MNSLVIMVINRRTLSFLVYKYTLTDRNQYSNGNLEFGVSKNEGLTIVLFHIVSAHAYIGHVARYFPIIGESLHRWGKRILSH